MDPAQEHPRRTGRLLGSAPGGEPGGEEISPRRVLPALLLAGTVGFLGLHRVYARRYWSGALQFVLFAAGAILIGNDVRGAMTLRTMEEIVDWAIQHPINPLYAVLLLVPSSWAIIDCALLVAGRFRDGSRQPIRRWI